MHEFWLKYPDGILIGIPTPFIEEELAQIPAYQDPVFLVAGASWRQFQRDDAQTGIRTFHRDASSRAEPSGAQLLQQFMKRSFLRHELVRTGSTR